MVTPTSYTKYSTEEIEQTLADYETVVASKEDLRLEVENWLFSNVVNFGTVMVDHTDYTRELHWQLAEGDMALPSSEAPNLKLRRYSSEQYPVAKWKKEIKAIRKYVATLRQIFEQSPDQCLSVSWWVE